eukprot:TRINITY_DN14728_c0_g1_i1.p1 TRINITY_DN14728_c0_g1~~TRINITY_DN14728_c0_g1_i1.p1  ORF type:complete len:513 (+),score=89.61 TRINITY_DN14728_c0_g1_i1:64-1602(+)
MQSSGRVNARRGRSRSPRGRTDRSRSPRGHAEREPPWRGVHDGRGGGSHRRREDGRPPEQENAYGSNQPPVAHWNPYLDWGVAANYWGEQAQPAAKKTKKRKKKRASSSSSSSDSQPDTSWNDMWQAWHHSSSMQSSMQQNTQEDVPAWAGGHGGWNQWGQPVGGQGGQVGNRQGGGRSAHHERDMGEESEDDFVAPHPDHDVPIFLEPSVEEFVPVPKALLGKVIGKQASTIIEIREKSGCYRVDARDQTSDPCQVKVAGTAGAVRMAKALIAELLEQTKKVNDGATIVDIPRAQIGKVMGMKGAQVGQIQKDTNTKIDFNFDTDPCKCFIKGDPENIERARKIIQTITMQILDEASEYLDFPKNVSGILIGTKGSRIRYLQEQSGARIDLDKNGPTCKVRLAGTREQVDMAKFLIDSELEKNMTPTRPPGATQFGLSNQGPKIVPAHQPTSFPATIDESIARARAAAEAVKHGLISMPEQAQEDELGGVSQDGTAGGGQWSGNWNQDGAW